MPRDLRTKQTPESYGWLRRLELDDRASDAWEKPNGDIVFHPRSARPLVVSPATKASTPLALAAGYFAHQSTLTAMILHAARLQAPGIAAIGLRFPEPDSFGINWRVAGTAFGSADVALARKAIAHAASVYRLFWVMVTDDDPRG